MVNKTIGLATASVFSLEFIKNPMGMILLVVIAVAAFFFSALAARAIRSIGRKWRLLKEEAHAVTAPELTPAEEEYDRLFT